MGKPTKRKKYRYNKTSGTIHDPEAWCHLAERMKPWNVEFVDEPPHGSHPCSLCATQRT
jgi:hypothetical protein